MQISGQIHACRENTLLILAFTLAIQLLPPLGHIMNAGFIIGKNLNILTFSQKNITNRCILQSIVVLKCILQRTLSSTCSTFHQLINVSTADSNGKQSYSSQYRETSSHIIRHHKSIVTFFISYLLKRSLSLVSGGVDSLSGTFLAIFGFQFLLEYPECDGRLSGSTGLGDHINREISVSYHIHQVLQISRTDGVTTEINLRSLTDALIYNIIETMSQKFDSCSRSQIGTADTDHQQYLRITLDLLGCFLHSGKLFLVILYRKIDPSQEIITRTALRYQHFLGIQCQFLHIAYFFRRNKCICFSIIKCNMFAHIIAPFP